MTIPKWALLLMVIIVLAGCGGREMEIPAEATPTDGTPQPPLPPPLPAGRAVVADGQLESPYPSLPLSFGGGASGRVLTITVKAGDAVEPGDLHRPL